MGILRINSLSANSVQTLNQIEMSNKIKDVNIVLPYRSIPAPLEKAVKLKLNELRECGIIERVDHLEWISPMVVVPKGNGELRICIDMRLTNSSIISTIESLLPYLGNAKFFSKLDFHQIGLHPSSRFITTFITKEELYRYTRMMFGMCYVDCPSPRDLPDKFREDFGTM